MKSSVFKIVLLRIINNAEDTIVIYLFYDYKNKYLIANCQTFIHVISNDC